MDYTSSSKAAACAHALVLLLAPGIAGCLGDASAQRAIASVALGGACGHDWECESGVCFAETASTSSGNSGGNTSSTPTGWTGGTCAAPCTASGCGATGACAAIGGEAWCIASCANLQACRSGYLCNTNDSTCLPDCRNPGFFCGAGYLCGADGRCAVSTSALAPVGGPCGRNADCRSGLCFAPVQGGKATGWTGGTCADVAPNNLCAAPGTAPAVLAGQEWCVAACSSTANCRPGYVCDPDFKACLPDCHTAGWSCGAGLGCNPDGTCTATSSTLELNGQLCSASTQCQSGYCQPTSAGGVSLGLPAPFCTAVCGPGLAPCSAGSFCAPSQAGDRCFAGCLSSTDCAAGFLCNPGNAMNPNPLCLPDCRTAGASCGPPPRACNQATGMCQ